MPTAQCECCMCGALVLQTRKCNSKEQSRWRVGSRRAGSNNCAVCSCHVYYQLLVLCQHGVQIPM